MKKTKYVLALLAVVMILTAGIGQAMAYFTTYAEADGAITIWLGDKTKIEETFSEWTKTLTITNEEGEPVFVRARVFYAPGDLDIRFDPEEEKGWSYKLPDGSKAGEDDLPKGNHTAYYYYNAPLAAGGPPAELKVNISNIPTDVVSGDTFNVIVVYESTPALYTDEGNAYADWASELNVTKRIIESPSKGGQ